MIVKVPPHWGCVASAELGQPEAEKMRDFARLQEACGRSEAHEQRRT